MTASLAVFSAIWGALAVIVFRRFTNRKAIRADLNRIYARLLEIRLYSDELSLVWQAQKSLIVDNLKFLARIAPAVLIMAVPFALLYPQLDAIYGTMPLQIGHTATVTFSGNSATLQTPEGIKIETEPVKDSAENQISWRIRPVSPVHGALIVTLPNGATRSRSIAAGPQILAPKYRNESSIAIDYQKADTPWLPWFLLISAITATAVHWAARPARLR